MSRAAAILLAAAALFSPAIHADTVTSQDGYEVRRSQAVAPVPQGMVGSKTIDRETRTGNTNETRGKSSEYTMTLGGFMRRCAVPEGASPVRFAVAGDFEYSLAVDTVDGGVPPGGHRHYEKRMTARIKAFVNDDLSVTEAEIDGEFVSDLDGVRSVPVPLHLRFPVRAYGTPDYNALAEAASVTRDVAAAALMWNASTAILDVMRSVREPNACAELRFDPPSGERAVGPGERVDVRVSYLTRDGGQLIPKGNWDAQPVGSGSRVAADRGEVREDGSFLVAYTAGGNPKEGDGVRIEAISAGGYARDMWKIGVGANYEGTFSQSQKMTTAVPGLAGYGAAATNNYLAEGRLVWTPEPGPARASTFGDVASRFYVPTDGEITVKIDTVEGKSIAGRCTYEGSKTFAIQSLPREALKYLELEVAADGRYRLMLGMISRYLQFQATRKCVFSVGGASSGTEIVNSATLMLGRQEGTVVDDAIAGRTAAPISEAGFLVTGEWQFRKSPPAAR